MTIHVIGSGIVAFRVQRLLGGERVLMHSPRERTPPTESGGTAVIAHAGSVVAQAAVLLERGTSVVTLSDDSNDIAGLRALEPVAVARDATLVVGAAMAPGLSGLLARHLASEFATVDEIHVGVHGTAGPACARRHHDALSQRVSGWHDGAWRDYVGGSGRDLAWFPEPIGGKDCYRARSGDTELMHAAFPAATRISYRRSARRRDRFTARLPMLSPPPTEGAIGGLRVEVRGADRQGRRHTAIAGIAEFVATAAAATAAAFTDWIEASDRGGHGVVLPGSDQLDTVDLLRRVERYGVRLQEFTGMV